jgi:hypothetical protein
VLFNYFKLDIILNGSNVFRSFTVTGMLSIAGLLEYTDSCQELQKLFSTTRRENSKQKKASEFLTLAFLLEEEIFIYLLE